MAAKANYYGSSDQLLHNVSVTSSVGSTTPCGYFDTLNMTDVGPFRKKNVKWSLGGDSAEGRSPLDTPDDPMESRRRTSEDVEQPSSRGQKLEREQESELRKSLSHVVLDNAGEVQQQLHLPPEAHTQQKRKSALRSGTSTPIITFSPPHELEDEVPNQGDKTRSADQAKKVAENLSKDLENDEQEASSPHRSRRAPFKFWANKGRKPSAKSELDLYHNGSRDLESGRATPDMAFDDDYIERPKKYRLAGFSAQQMQAWLSASSRRNSIEESEPPSPATNSSHGPSWFRSPRGSVSSLAELVRPSHMTRNRSDPGVSSAFYESSTPVTSASNLLKVVKQKASATKQKNKKECGPMIARHIRETRTRLQYLRVLCKALIEYGAPTHRLESFMGRSSDVLRIEAYWLYLPGCMVVSFDDSESHTSDVKLVRAQEGVDLGKLRDTHIVYKEVCHDKIGVDEALERLQNIKNRSARFNKWVSILAHGFASLSVAPFAFKARFVDLGPAFVLGSLLGFMRLYFAKGSDLYANIWEIFSIVALSALSRLLGSAKGGDLFCFSALAQSSIALILPGYIVLCGALELQNKSLVAGSVRMVYAIIYSLFIGFGLTIGSAIVGWGLKTRAISSATCTDPVSNLWYFLFVPLFALCLMVINQAKYKQMPIMLFIACAGYVVNYVPTLYQPNMGLVSSSLAAATISVLANIYSRVGDKLDGPFERWFGNILGGKQIVRKSKVFITGNTGHKDEEKQAEGSARDEPKEPRDPSSQEHPTPDISDQSSRAGSDEAEKDSEGRRQGMDGADKDRPEIRVAYSPAAPVMLPAIFVLVPSGLAVSGSLVQGITNADALVHNTTTPAATPGSSSSLTGLTSNTAFTVGFNVVQVAIGITVGLYIGTVLIYPLGKTGKWSKKDNRSELFTMG